MTKAERGTPNDLGRPEFPCVGTNAMRALDPRTLPGRLRNLGSASPAAASDPAVARAKQDVQSALAVLGPLRSNLADYATELDARPWICVSNLPYNVATPIVARFLEEAGVKTADVEVVFDPVWDRSMMSEAARLQTGMF